MTPRLYSAPIVAGTAITPISAFVAKFLALTSLTRTATVRVWWMGVVSACIMTPMADVTKRTYNLPAATIHTVRELAAALDMPQDAVVARAISELARAQRDAADGARWQAAAMDPQFQAEMEAVASEFFSDDLAAWPS
jgi:hypothetical protein